MEEEIRRLQRLAAVGQYAAAMVHEIRNPLTAIRGFLQLLQEEGGTGASAEYCRVMLQEIDHIDGMLRNLLLLAKPAAPSRVPADLCALAEEVLLLEQAECAQRGVALERAFAPGLPPVPVDPGMFRHLVYNLLANGLQAMPEGGCLRVALERAEPAHVMLTVSDTGVGIPPENLGRLFQPFFTTKPEGTGLGLTVCQAIAEAHGGRIAADSEGGRGSTFRVLLPLSD